MSESPSRPTLDELLERLHQGHAHAIEAIFRTCEPFLRLLVRRQLDSALRAKLDSQDVVQSVWVGLLREFQAGGGRFTSADHLKAYLVRATRNRLIDHYRAHRIALEREQQLTESEEEQLLSRVPRPSQTVHVREVWVKIQALCSPDQAVVVELRRQGLTMEEIAQRTGLHPSSVRRILYDLARRLGLDSKASR